jgi:hypothetical protein
MINLGRSAALALAGLVLHLGQANASGPGSCFSQAQCKSQEFCGVDPNNHGRGSCMPADVWPLTSSNTTSDVNTGIYGFSAVVVGGGPPPAPGYERPEPDFSGACVTITKIHPGSSSTNQIVPKAECDKKGNFRIALPVGDYLLKGRGGSQTVHVTTGIFQNAMLAQFLNAP